MATADPFDDALRVIAELNNAKVDYAVFGGMALNIHGVIRATEDLDIFLRPDAENIARLRAALSAVWTDPDIEQITAADLCGEYPAVRYGPPGGLLYLDLVTRLGDAFAWKDLEIETVDIEKIAVRVVSPRTLYRMKRDTVRPLDRADAAALRRAFSLEDEDK